MWAIRAMAAEPRNMINAGAVMSKLMRREALNIPAFGSAGVTVSVRARAINALTRQTTKALTLIIVKFFLLSIAVV